MKKILKVISSFLLTFYCMYIFCNLLTVHGNALLSVRSFSAILLTGLLVWLFYRTFGEQDKRKRIVSLVISFVLANFVLLGNTWVEFGTNAIISRYYAFGFLAVWAVIHSCLLLLINMLPMISCKLESINVNHWLADKLPGGKKRLFIYWAIILVCWLPAFLAMFPGNATYDMYPQMVQIFEGPLTTHHPLVHTYFLYACMKFGELFGNYNIGMVLHSIIQSVAMSYIFALCCYKTRKQHLPEFGQILMVLFFAINPLIQVAIFSTTKDVFFAGFFLLVVQQSYEIIASPDEFFANKKSQITYFLLIIAMALFRNQGIYILIAATPFMAVLLKKHWKRVIICCFATVVCIWTLTSGLPKLAGIQSGDKREMLSVPMQQVVRTLLDDNPDVTEEQKEAVYDIIPEDQIQNYNAYSADPIKSVFNTEKLEENLFYYVSVWAQIGIQNPSTYLDAVIATTWQYWYPGEGDYPYDGSWYDGAFTDLLQRDFGLVRTPLFPQYDRFLRGVGVYQEMTPFSLIFTIEAYPIWIILLLVGVAIIKRRKETVLSLVFMIGYFGTILLGPVALKRYILPLSVCIPYMLAMIFYQMRKTDSKEKSEEQLIETNQKSEAK